MLKKKIISTGAGLVGLALAATLAFAQPGTAIQPPIPACVGIGVAYDGTDILYTCAGDPSIHKTDLTGVPNVVVPTTDGAGNPLSVDAIAWDPNEGMLWGGELADTSGDLANDTCNIWSIDMSTGVGTLRFSYIDPHGGCSFSFYDGLTVDTLTNTVWASPDIHRFIHHYQKDGTEIPGDLIAFSDLTVGLCPFAQGFGNNGCWNSGLTIGLDGNLFAGTNGDGKIFQLNPAGGGSLIGQFATVSGRDEDLECGPVVDGKETILSKQLEGPIDVLEAPEGTCVSPTDETPPEVSCTESVNPHGAKIPPAGKSTPPGTNPNSGVNEDGFYHLGAKDDSGLPVDIFVTNASGTFTAGPYPSSTTVKITEAPGVTPTSKPMGSSSGAAGAVTAYITLDSDALVYGVDAAGNVSDPITCLVPPPPK